MDDIKRSRAVLEDATVHDSKRPLSGSIDANVSDLVKDANECISFRLVGYDEPLVGDEDGLGGDMFGPLMSHQIYGG